MDAYAPQEFMNSARNLYLSRIREETSYGTLRFLIDACAVLGIASVAIATFVAWSRLQGAPALLLAASSLAEIILVFGGRELLRMLVDHVDASIDMASRPSAAPPTSGQG
jgi:hypothetical protein